MLTCFEIFQAIGIALETRRLDMLQKALKQAVSSFNNYRCQILRVQSVLFGRLHFLADAGLDLLRMDNLYSL